MSIYQETSNIQPRGAASDIITNKRSIETNVLVDDGQIIVLGGLIEDSVNDTEEKVPGLGDIPVLGNLFKYQTRGRTKTNLMVFLRPTVVRTNEQSVNVAGDRYNYIRNQELGAQPQPALTMPNLGAPLMPQLQNGRMVDGPLLNLTNQAQGIPAVQVNPQQPPPQQPLQQPAAPE
jgi:general secretion pathway protein D